MKQLLATLIFLTVGHAVSGAESRPVPVDEVSQAAIQSAFQILRRDYIRRDDLTLDQLNRAALHGLLERLNFGAELIKTSASPAQADNRVISERLTAGVGCLRPTALSEPEIAPMREALHQFQEQGVKHVILDLRSPAPPGEFETAAAILELFLPKDQLLFKLRQLGQGDAQMMLSKHDPVWTGTLVVLVDNETNNLGETIAAVLREQKRGLLVGASTKGATVRYETVPLEAGWRLRFARAEVLLPDDSSVFRKGLTPDLLVKMDPKVKHEIFKSHTIKPSTFEQARPRFNEAALVAGTNPEIDDYIRRSGGEVMPYDRPQQHDTVMQRAVDLLLATDHFSASTLNWQKFAAGASEPTALRGEPVLSP